MGYSIAIDGPAGAGKSTVAKKVAKKLGYVYVDTGAMYRAMGLYFIREGINENEIYTAKASAKCNDADISICHVNGEQIVYLNGENVTGLLRTEEVGTMASICGTNPDVRAKLVVLQKRLAEIEDVVMEGRDIGTCVLPDANVKFFLTATVEERAKRRYKELTEKGVSCDIKSLEADIKERDHRDRTREISPLSQAADAIVIDSSNMTIDQVVSQIILLAPSNKELSYEDELVRILLKQDKTPAKVFLIEEMSELTKELMKEERKNDNVDDIIGEVIDVYTTLLIYCKEKGISSDVIKEGVRKKLERGIARTKLESK